MTSRLLTAAHVAEMLGVTEAALYTMRWVGSAPPAIKIGGRVRWREDDVLRWIEEHREVAK